MESTSAMSESPWRLKRSSRDARLGKSTLSSLAFPSIEEGSSCSLSMLNLAERFGIRRLVRKSSCGGSAVARLISGLGGSGTACFFRLNVLDERLGIGGVSVSCEGRRLPFSVSPRDFFLERKRFMLSAALVVYNR